MDNVIHIIMTNSSEILTWWTLTVEGVIKVNILKLIIPFIENYIFSYCCLNLCTCINKVEYSNNSQLVIIH